MGIELNYRIVSLGHWNVGNLSFSYKKKGALREQKFLLSEDQDHNGHL